MYAMTANTDKTEVDQSISISSVKSFNVGYSKPLGKV